MVPPVVFHAPWNFLGSTPHESFTPDHHKNTPRIFEISKTMAPGGPPELRICLEGDLDMEISMVGSWGPGASVLIDFGALGGSFFFFF